MTYLDIITLSSKTITSFNNINNLITPYNISQCLPAVSLVSVMWAPAGAWRCHGPWDCETGSSCLLPLWLGWSCCLCSSGLADRKYEHTGSFHFSYFYLHTPQSQDIKLTSHLSRIIYFTFLFDWLGGEIHICISTPTLVAPNRSCNGAVAPK